MSWEGKRDRRNDLTRDPGREGAEERANNHKKGPNYKTDIRNRGKVKIVGCNL